MLHTDDLAWHHGVFSWDELLINDVLPVLRDRHALHYRPPAWVGRSRDGAITLDGDRDFVIIEGVGASQASVRPELDVIIWVETPQSARESRDASRIAAGETSAASYARWMAEENAYMAAERPWEHATSSSTDAAVSTMIRKRQSSSASPDHRSGSTSHVASDVEIEGGGEVGG